MDEEVTRSKRMECLGSFASIEVEKKKKFVFGVPINNKFHLPFFLGRLTKFL